MSQKNANVVRRSPEKALREYLTSQRMHEERLGVLQRNLDAGDEPRFKYGALCVTLDMMRLVRADRRTGLAAVVKGRARDMERKMGPYRGKSEESLFHAARMQELFATVFADSTAGRPVDVGQLNHGLLGILHQTSDPRSRDSVQSPVSDQLRRSLVVQYAFWRARQRSAGLYAMRPALAREAYGAKQAQAWDLAVSDTSPYANEQLHVRLVDHDTRYRAPHIVPLHTRKDLGIEDVQQYVADAFTEALAPRGSVLIPEPVTDRLGCIEGQLLQHLGIESAV